MPFFFNTGDACFEDGLANEQWKKGRHTGNGLHFPQTSNESNPPEIQALCIRSCSGYLHLGTSKVGE